LCARAAWRRHKDAVQAEEPMTAHVREPGGDVRLFLFEFFLLYLKTKNLFVVAGTPMFAVCYS
jgi:hypothetical protein